MISLAGHPFGRRRGLAVRDRLGRDCRAARRVERDTVCIDLPACYECQIFRHRRREIVFFVAEIPADEIIPLTGDVRRCRRGAAVRDRLGRDCRAACRVKGHGMRLHRPAGDDCDVLAHRRECIFCIIEVPPHEGVTLTLRVCRGGGHLSLTDRDDGRFSTVCRVECDFHRFAAADKGGDRQCGEEHQYRKGDDVLFLFHKCLRLTARVDSSGGHFSMIIIV